MQVNHFFYFFVCHLKSNLNSGLNTLKRLDPGNCYGFIPVNGLVINNHMMLKCVLSAPDAEVGDNKQLCQQPGFS